MTLITIWGTPWPQIWTELDEIFTTDSQELRSKFKITADDVVYCVTRKLELFWHFWKSNLCWCTNLSGSSYATNLNKVSKCFLLTSFPWSSLNKASLYNLSVRVSSSIEKTPKNDQKWLFYPLENWGLVYHLSKGIWKTI